MTKIAIEDVAAALNERRRINQLDLSEITWQLDGKDVEINKKTIERFAFTGLSNIDFISSGFWLKNIDEKVREKAAKINKN